MKISVQWSCLLAYSYKKHGDFCQRNKDTVPGTIRHCCLLDSASIHLVAVFTATVLVRRHPFLQGFPSFTSTPLSLIETFGFSPIKICCPTDQSCSQKVRCNLQLCSVIFANFGCRINFIHEAKRVFQLKPNSSINFLS